MQRNPWITIVIIGMSILFLAGAASRLRPLHEQRSRANLGVADPLAEQRVSAELRLPIAALATFRALAIDYLWITADKHKDEGEYFDALHLARMICALQPNLESVWSFQAWNMAYNISVALPTGYERWHWVQAGYKLLRDEALKHNPESLKLHRELGWIFQHKIGGYTDDQHRYYKLMMALELEPLLTRLSDGAMNTNGDFADMAAITRGWAELLEDEQVAELVTRMKEVEPNFETEEDVREGLIRFRVEPKRFSPPFHQLIEDHRHTEALKKLDVFVRAQKLREQWKLEPARMLEINREYGPLDFTVEDTDQEVHLSLDWRLPFSHAMYWALKGSEYIGDRTGGDVDVMNLYRVVYQSLQDHYHFGRMTIPSREMIPTPEEEWKKGQEILEVPDVMQELVFNSQDIRMFPVAYQASLDLIDKLLEEDPEDEPSGLIAFSENLCRNGVTSLYLAGYKKWAEKYLVHLRKRYPEDEAYQVVSVDHFVRNLIRDEVESSISPKNASNYIKNLLRASYHDYGIGEDENAYIKEEWARQFYQEYKRQHPDVDDPTKRMSFDMQDLRWEALEVFFNDPFVNPNVKRSLLARLETLNPELYERVRKSIEEVRRQMQEKEMGRGM